MYKKLILKDLTAVTTTTAKAKPHFPSIYKSLTTIPSNKPPVQFARRGRAKSTAEALKEDTKAADNTSKAALKEASNEDDDDSILIGISIRRRTGAPIPKTPKLKEITETATIRKKRLAQEKINIQTRLNEETAQMEVQTELNKATLDYSEGQNE